MIFQQIRGTTAIITYGGKNFLVNPFFSPETKPESESISGGASESMVGPLVQIPFPPSLIVSSADAVIATHIWRPDHFDQEAQAVIPKDMPIFVQSDNHAYGLSCLGFTNVKTIPFDGICFDGVTIFQTQALAAIGQDFQRHARRNFTTALDRSLPISPCCGTSYSTQTSADTSEQYFTGFEFTAEDQIDCRSLQSEPCGFALECSGEKRFWYADEGLLFEGTFTALAFHIPEVIALTPTAALDSFGHPCMMSSEDALRIAELSPHSSVIATGMETWTYDRTTRKEVSRIVEEAGLTERFFIPSNGESVEF